MGRPVPSELVDEERVAAIFALAAQIVLEKARAAYDGPMMVLKGPVVAALYPDPALRPFRDLDLLVPNAEEAQETLIASGFVPVGNEDSYYAELHHLRPLSWPGLPLVVEVHRRPEWPKWTKAPATDELFGEAEPALTVGVDGLLAPNRSHHALIVAAHSWAEAPLRRALDLVDVTVLSSGLDRDELRRLAHRWDIAGLWETTVAAAQALLFDARTPLSLRLWARDLRSTRDRTVLENHVRFLASSFWALPPRRALRVTGQRVLEAAKPAMEESWHRKLGRTGLAFRNAFTGLSEHNLVLRRREEELSDPNVERSA
jgi:putative nucleotidyltransferase-like protein